MTYSHQYCGNIYLHYALDSWFELEFKQMHPDAYLIRYCDDFIAILPSASAADELLKDLQKQLADYKLTLSGNKTLNFDFRNRAFNLLGFNVHYIPYLKSIDPKPSTSAYTKILNEVDDKIQNCLHSYYSGNTSLRLTYQRVRTAVSELLNSWYSYYGYKSNQYILDSVYSYACKRVIYWFGKLDSSGTDWRCLYGVLPTCQTSLQATTVLSVLL